MTNAYAGHPLTPGGPGRNRLKVIEQEIIATELQLANVSPKLNGGIVHQCLGDADPSLLSHKGQPGTDPVIAEGCISKNCSGWRPLKK